MKRILMWGAALAALGASAARASVDITARGQYFLPADKAFRDVYGGGWKAGGELGVDLTRRFGLWAGGDYLSRKGKLTFTGEETKLTVIPAGGGVRYRLTTGAASLYAAAGVLVCQFKEQNMIGRVSSTGLGGTLRLGLLLRPVRYFLLHLGAGYSYCPMKPADFNIDVGGLEGGAGLAVEF